MRRQSKPHCSQRKMFSLTMTLRETSWSAMQRPLLFATGCLLSFGWIAHHMWWWWVDDGEDDDDQKPDDKRCSFLLAPRCLLLLSAELACLCMMRYQTSSLDVTRLHRSYISHRIPLLKCLLHNVLYHLQLAAYRPVSIAGSQARSN